MHQIYRDKIEADKVDDEANNARQSMPEYVYDWFLTKYGLRKLADQQLLKMFVTVAVSGKAVIERERERDPEDGVPATPSTTSSDGRQPDEIRLASAYLNTFGRQVGV